MFNGLLKKLPSAVTPKSSVLQKAQTFYAEMKNSDPEQTLELWDELVANLDKANVGYDVLDPSQPDAEKVEAEIVNRVRESYLRRVKAIYGTLMEMSQKTELEKIMAFDAEKRKAPLLLQCLDVTTLEKDLEKLGSGYEVFCTPENDKTAEAIKLDVEQAHKAISEAFEIAKSRELCHVLYHALCFTDDVDVVFEAYEKLVKNLANTSDHFDKIFPVNVEPQCLPKTRDDVKKIYDEICLKRAKEVLYESYYTFNSAQEAGEEFSRVSDLCKKHGLNVKSENPLDPSVSWNSILDELSTIVKCEQRRRNLLCGSVTLSHLRPEAMKDDNMRGSLENRPFKVGAIQKAQSLYAAMETSDPDKIMDVWTALTENLNKARVGYEILSVDYDEEKFEYRMSDSQRKKFALSVECTLLDFVHDSYLRRAQTSYDKLMTMSQEDELEKIRESALKNEKQFANFDPFAETEKIKGDLEKIDADFSIFYKGEDDGKDEAALRNRDRTVHYALLIACEEIYCAIKTPAIRAAYQKLCSAKTLSEARPYYKEVVGILDKVDHNCGNFFPVGSKEYEEAGSSTVKGLLNSCNERCRTLVRQEVYSSLDGRKAPENVGAVCSNEMRLKRRPQAMKNQNRPEVLKR